MTQMNWKFETEIYYLINTKQQNNHYVWNKM